METLNSKKNLKTSAPGKAQNAKNPLSYRSSKQREQILSYLQGVHNHPTAQEIYKNLKPQIPSLSLGNLYRNLGILAEQRLIAKIHQPENDELRYDGTVDDHYHFTCRKCQGLFDLEDQGLQEDLKKPGNFGTFKVEAIAIHLYGLCPECAKKENTEAVF